MRLQTTVTNKGSGITTDHLFTGLPERVGLDERACDIVAYLLRHMPHGAKVTIDLPGVTATYRDVMSS